MAVVNGESCARPEDAPFDLDKSSVVDVVDGIEDIDADTGDVTVCARALSTPKSPAPSVVAHHNLTHFQYRRPKLQLISTPGITTYGMNSYYFGATSKHNLQLGFDCTSTRTQTLNNLRDTTLFWSALTCTRVRGSMCKL